MPPSPRPGGAVFAPPSRHHETQSPLPGPSRSRGAQFGNTNALKNGFYTRRFKKQDLSGVDQVNLKSLAEEIALIRIYTRRLIESTRSSDDPYEIAAVLRYICLASATISHAIKTHALLSSGLSDFDQSVDEAIRQISLEYGLDEPLHSPSPPTAAQPLPAPDLPDPGDS